jgi:hypothetical protein
MCHGWGGRRAAGQGRRGSPTGSPRSRRGPDRVADGHRHHRARDPAAAGRRDLADQSRRAGRLRYRICTHHRLPSRQMPCLDGIAWDDLTGEKVAAAHCCRPARRTTVRPEPGDSCRTRSCLAPENRLNCFWNSPFSPVRSRRALRCLLSRCLSSGECVAKFSGPKPSRLVGSGTRSVCGTVLSASPPVSYPVPGLTLA